MKRFIIALLALLGLVAQGAPVSARLGGTAAAQHGAVLEQNVQRQKLVARQAVRQSGFAQPERRGEASFSVLDGTFKTVRAPTVNIGIDRARQ